MNVALFLRKPGFGTSLLVVLFIAAGLLLWHNSEHFKVLLNIGIYDLVLLLAISLLSFLITATISWHLLRVVGVWTHWTINLALTFLANFLNYFGPAQPGLMAKALYLKKANQVRYTDFGIVTVVNALIMVLAASMVGSLVAYLEWLRDGELPMFGFLSIGMLTMLFGLLWLGTRLPYIEGTSWWRRILNEILSGIADLSTRHFALFISVGLVLVQYVVAGVVVWLSYSVTGIHLTYFHAVLIAAFVSVANIVPVTPNNIGISELLMGAAIHLESGDFSTGLLAGTIIRACHLVICIGAMPYAHWRLAKNQ